MARFAASFGPDELAEELLETDAAYFCAGAETEELGGYRIAYLPGLAELAAACVVHPQSSTAGLAQALPRLEQRIARLGYGHARIYQWAPDPEAESLLLRRGYRKETEIALLNSKMDPAPAGDETAATVLRPVVSERDWSAKLALHRDINLGPDGHESPADAWLEMERRKCEAGYMKAFLIVLHEQVCGAVGFAPSARIGRLKNIVIHPRFRGMGIGAQAARLIAAMARKDGKAAAGCFAMGDGVALKMYENADYHPVAEQTEWYRKLG